MSLENGRTRQGPDIDIIFDGIDCARIRAFDPAPEDKHKNSGGYEKGAEP
jgi:hypothetical protein